MPKPFSEIETDAEYLRAVGMGPDKCKHLYNFNQGILAERYGRITYTGPSIALHDTDPARKWDNIGNVLRVLGPEMDRRGWLMWRKDYKNYSDVTLFDKHGAMPGNGCAVLPHLALLQAFYNAHAAQGDDA